MSKIIVASFKEEAKAIEASHKLNELEYYGDISIYEKVMIRANKNRQYEILEEDTDEGWRTLTGMTVGGLLGLLGGPVGFAVGLVAGTTIGAMSDVSNYDFASDFVSKVENRLPEGSVAIIAEVNEYSDVFIDTSLKSLGAVIFRSDVDYEFDNFVNEQIDAIDADIEEARADLKKSVESDKEKISKKISELKERRKKVIAKAKSNMKSFNDKIKDSVNETKADFIKSRIAGHEAKLNKLNKDLKEVQHSAV